MRFNPLEYFVGRNKEIALFDELLSNDQKCWVMLVDGLSGTGKSLLVDWLINNRCNEIPHARLTLALSANTSDVMSSIAEQVHPKVSNQYVQGVARLRAVEESQQLVSYSPTLDMSASAGGLVQDNTQSVSMDIGNLAMLVKEERETKRLDLLMDTLAQHLKGKIWVLFVDESGYLDNPDLERFFLKKLIPRLHNRFPRFRLYLTGQSVPTAKFSKHERLETTLLAFQESEVKTLSQKVGIDDAKYQKNIFSISLGHPLLASMLVEHILESGSERVKADAKELERTLEEGKRTEWIYGRILDTILDPGLRDIAANLSLFEWFDLSLLRSIFGQQISEKSFDELVRRSFVKALEDGTWRCHDIIIKYLRPHRQSLLKDETRQIYRKTYTALQERIADREEIEGIWSFSQRVNLTSAALSSLLEVSLSEAHDYLLTEIALAFYNDLDYLYPLIRYCENCPAPEIIHQEVQGAKQYIEAFNLEQFNPGLASFFDRLGQHLFQQGNLSLASDYCQIAAILYSAHEENEKAIASATRACEYDANIENQAVAVRVYTEAGKFDSAEQMLVNLELQYGDQALLDVERARLAYAQGQSDRGLQILFESITRHPEDIEARQALMQILWEDDQDEAALSQAEAILKIDPGNAQALEMRMEAMLLLEHYDDFMSLIRKSDVPLASMIDNLAAVTGMLNDPVIRGRWMAELEVDPESVSSVSALVLASYFSARGDISITDQLVKSIENRLPEYLPVCQMYRAMARFNAGQVQEARSLAESLINRGDSVPDTYFTLAYCYIQQGELDKAIRLLEELVARFPYIRDLAESTTAQAYLAVERPDDALDYLMQADAEHELGPFAQDALSYIYYSVGRLAEARQVLEELIYTAERSELPIQRQIIVRARYAALLAESGEKDKAAEIAYSLLDLSVDATLTAPQAAGIFFSLQDEEGLRASYQSTRSWDASQENQFLNLIASLILQRNQSVEGLLAEYEAHPDRLEIVAALDMFITQTGQLNLAPEIVQRVEKIAPGSYASFMKIINDALRQAGPAQILQLQAAIAEEPDNSSLYLALGRYKLAMGKYSEAKMALDEAVRLNPAFKELALVFQVNSYLDGGELERARELLEPYLTDPPPPLAVLESIIRYLVAIGDRELEIKMLESAAQVYPHLRQQSIEQIVDYEINDGRYEHALEIIDNLRAEEELAFGLVVSQALALRYLERYDESIMVLDELLAIPDLTDLLRSTIHNYRAETCLAANLIDEAQDSYLKAIELEDDDADLYFGLAGVCLEKEDWDMAYEAIMHGLALDPAMLTEYQEILREITEKREVNGSS